MNIFKNKKTRGQEMERMPLDECYEQYEKETSISGSDKTFTKIKCLGFTKENGPLQIQISIENRPYSLRVMKWLTLEDARHFRKILDYQISLAEGNGDLSSFFARLPEELHDK